MSECGPGSVLVEIGFKIQINPNLMRKGRFERDRQLCLPSDLVPCAPDILPANTPQTVQADAQEYQLIVYRENQLIVLSGIAPDESHAVKEGVLYELRVVLAPALAAMAHPPLVQRPFVKVDARCGSLYKKHVFLNLCNVCPDLALVK